MTSASTARSRSTSAFLFPRIGAPRLDNIDRNSAFVRDNNSSSSIDGIVSPSPLPISSEAPTSSSSPMTSRDSETIGSSSSGTASTIGSSSSGTASANGKSSSGAASTAGNSSYLSAPPCKPSPFTCDSTFDGRTVFASSGISSNCVAKLGAVDNSTSSSSSYCETSMVTSSIVNVD